MRLLEERILKDGVAAPGGILRVDSFLNHQIDIDLYNEIGREFKRLFHDTEITKILTIEASGIGIACITAQYFHVPVVFAKKSKSANLGVDEVYTSKVESFTHGRTYDITVNRKYILPTDKILIIDDFLANGKALLGLMEIIKSAGASLSGIGICIEKAFQPGGSLIRSMGINLKSLAIVKSVSDDGRVEFAQQE